MLVVPFVCAEFHEASGKVIHRIRAHELRTIVTVPDEIVQDPLFAMMVEDGSLKAPENKLELKTLENDPETAREKNEKPEKSGKTTKVVKAAKVDPNEKTEKVSKTETKNETEKADRVSKIETISETEKNEKAGKSEPANMAERTETGGKTETVHQTEKTGKAEKRAMEPDKPEDTPAAADVKTDAGQNFAK